jgi:asparagine N-glycosylation enzyme membrane subunit Stt3
MLAHLIFRNSDGSFTASGWYWLVISTFVFAGAMFTLVVPQATVRRARLQNVGQAVVMVRLFSLLVGAGAIWFGVMAITAGPGQLV